MPQIQANKDKGILIDDTCTDSHQEKKLNSTSEESDVENNEEDILETIEEQGFQIAVDNFELQVGLEKCKAGKSSKKIPCKSKKNITFLDTLMRSNRNTKGTHSKHK